MQQAGAHKPIHEARHFSQHALDPLSNEPAGQRIGPNLAATEGTGGGLQASEQKDDMWRNQQPVAAYGTLLNRRSVMRGSIAAELSTFWEKAGATRIPRTLSGDTPLDSMLPRYDVSWV